MENARTPMQSTKKKKKITYRFKPRNEQEREIQRTNNSRYEQERKISKRMKCMSERRRNNSNSDKEERRKKQKKKRQKCRNKRQTKIDLLVSTDLCIYKHCV